MDPVVQKDGEAFLRGAARFLIAVFLWSVSAIAAWAAVENEPIKVRIPLPEVAPVSVHKLQGAYSGFDFSFSVPERWDVREAVLTFPYVNSTALLRENSRLTVELNRHPLAQVVLDPLSPEGKVSVRLPVNLLVPGYNELSFKVSQHYVLECEDPTAPELWTVLKLDEAFLDLVFSLKPLPLRLSILPTLVFDPANPRPEKVHIVVASTSREDVERAVLTASAIAVRFSYRPVEFSVSDHLEPGRDNVVVGDSKFFGRIFGNSAPKTEGAYLEVRHMPRPDGNQPDYGHVVILVGGPDDASVKKALRALAFLSFPFPDTASTVIREVVPPPVGPYEALNMLQLGLTYTFRDLGFPSFTFRGYRPAPYVLRFRLPSDILIKPHKYATMSLHVAYSAGMREDSVLALFMNGKFFASIPLSEKTGAHYEGYKITFPTYLLRPGENELAFHAVLTPLITGRCAYIQADHLLLTLFDDSTLRLPEISHWVELPDLTLFFKDGFPFGRYPDGREAALFLPKANFSSLEAAVNLVGVMSQKTGYPMIGLQVWDSLKKDPKVNVIAVGTLDALPEDLLGSAPYHLTQPIRAAYPVASPPSAETSEGEGWVNRRLRQLLGLSTPLRESPLAPLVQSNQTGSLGSYRAALMEYRLPGTSDRTLLVLTAYDGETLTKAGRSLWSFETQGACRGDLALFTWDGPKTRVQTLRVSSSYWVGSLTPLTRLDFFVYTYPWIFVLSLILALALLSYILYRLLRRYRRRRLNESGT